MIAFKSAPAFLFAYVSRKPRSKAELSEVPALRRQQLGLLTFAKQHDVTISERFVAVATYRRKSFVDEPQFASALARARTDSHPLLIANIRDLLVRTAPDLLQGCLQKLDGIDVDIFDVATTQFWRDFHDVARLGILSAASARRETGKAISLGKKFAEPGQLNIRQNQLAGAASNRRKADRQAEEYRPIVEQLEAGLLEGEALSPTLLMRRLNELDIKPARSERWSLNGAKRILIRLRRKDHDESAG